MTSASVIRTDEELTAIAEAVLAEAGFVVARESIEGGDLVLAENPYFIVAVAAMPTLGDLYAAEPVVEAILSDRITAGDVGPKVWDAYLVLLTQERPSDQGDGLRPLFGINYDTRRLRRMARAGVAATMHGVRLALAPFVEPVRLEQAATDVDPFRAMKDALVARGVESDFAARVVDLFQQGGRIDDAI